MAKIFTPWFPHHTKPVRPGVYRTRFDGVEGWSYFDGERWGWQVWVYHKAKPAHISAYSLQEKEWFGLAQAEPVADVSFVGGSHG
ncbi:hypothetical protein 8G_00044 [Ralstonia phage Hyacinthe]|uniref:Uncharacterized protein n=3 Tax=Rahariannevirus raharianne TaxID=2846050 RepID=A0A7G5BBF9_9CAUD|nr:hypothetical protein KMC43_gp63 [Ralstonia phage Raharianne]QMV32438.1 hypothetical protein U2_00063 [Ralstonia phage Albius]QMV33476.1 hypothetical protein 8G_00044 [Ralstonia phage Hyacinthe]QMV33632.1 hypothetical protein Y2_00063 [Ralstonia phage Raharianne]